MFQSSKHRINKMVIITLTHWGRVMHICVGKLTIICSDNGLSPGRCQAIIWTNAGILLIVPLGTNFSEISIGIQTFSFKKLHLKMSSAKWRPFCLGLNVLNENCIIHICWELLVWYSLNLWPSNCYNVLAHAIAQLLHHVNGLVQDWGNSSALAMELLQSSTKPSM